MPCKHRWFPWLFLVEASKVFKCWFDCAGNIRRFRRVCEHIQSQVCSRHPPSSPRASRKFTTELSESSSCGSDTSDRLSPYLGTRQVSLGSSKHDAGNQTSVWSRLFLRSRRNSVQTMDVKFCTKDSVSCKTRFRILPPLAADHTRRALTIVQIHGSGQLSRFTDLYLCYTGMSPDLS